MTPGTTNAFSEFKLAVKFLAELLRSDEPLNAQIRNIIADLIDESSEADYGLKFIKRSSGAPKSPPIFHLEKGLRLRQLLQEGVVRKQAVFITSNEFKCSTSTVETGYKVLMDGKNKRGEVSEEINLLSKQKNPNDDASK